jgi:NAD(P)-dependent dehydrogenase (short-subunit alcohol dehydrogenase family)
MIKRNHGHIITMLGSTAIFGLGNFSAICTAKSGLVGLMESVDHELTLEGYDGIYTTAAVSHYLTTHLLQLSKTCFNPVVPPLTLDYAAKKIMHAVLVGFFVYYEFESIVILFRLIENLYVYLVFII